VDAQRTNVEASTLQNVAEQTRQNRKAGIVQAGVPPHLRHGEAENRPHHRLPRTGAAGGGDPLMGG